MSDPSDPAAAAAEPEPMTAPGAPITVPQEQLDRYAALVMHVMQLRNYVELHRARLPDELVRRWDAWYQGFGQVLQRAQTDQLGLRHLLAQLPSYRAELTQYRDAFASHGGPQLEVSTTPAAPREGFELKPAMIGGAGLALGLVAGFLVAGSRR